MEEINKSVCGCEFTSYWNESGSCCFLSKCRCQKHYEEQFIVKWIDSEGEHCEEIDNSNALPLVRS